MAKPRNDVESVSITISTTPQVRRALQKLVKTGFHGKNPAEAAERIVAEVLDRKPLVYISDFGEERYEVARPIPILIRPDEDEFVASFYEANVHASGSTDQEAFDNLRSVILDTYESLRDASEENLARPALSQWRILSKFIKGHPSADTKRR